MERPVILRSRIVLPLSAPPISDGAVLVSGNRIRSVGSWNEIKTKAAAEICDLGETILLPGLINAHCHLDYTGMAGKIAPTKIFPDWIKSILTLKAAFSENDYASSWRTGAEMLLHTGTTTVADIEAVSNLLPEIWNSTPLRIFSFLELTSVKSGRSADDILREAEEKIQSAEPFRNRLQLSPHALYSTTPELLRRSAILSRKNRWKITTHVAESLEEFEMFQQRCGPLFEWLKPLRDMSDCSGISPVQQLEKCGMLSPDFLAVHVNYLAPGDAELLAQSGSSVVHCPESHRYFRHQKFPVAELSRARVNICLGTDSLASTQKNQSSAFELNMFSEMQTFSRENPQIAPETILKMATMNGAKALGMTGELGEISAGACADLIAIPFSGPGKNALEAALQHRGKIAASMIDGRFVESF